MNEVEERGEQQAQVLGQPGEPLLGVEPGEPGLHGQNEEDHGRDGGHRLLVVVARARAVHRQDEVEEGADVVAQRADHARHAQHGDQRLGAAAQQMLGRHRGVLRQDPRGVLRTPQPERVSGAIMSPNLTDEVE